MRYKTPNEIWPKISRNMGDIEKLVNEAEVNTAVPADEINDKIGGMKISPENVPTECEASS